MLEPQVTAHAGELFAVLGGPAICDFGNEPPSSLEWLSARFERLESRRFSRRHRADRVRVRARVLGNGFAHEAVVRMRRELAQRYRVATAGAVFKRTDYRSLPLLERLGMGAARAPQFAGGLAAKDEGAMAKRPHDAPGEATDRR
jgi:hypothetical protein